MSFVESDYLKRKKYREPKANQTIKLHAITHNGVSRGLVARTKWYFTSFLPSIIHMVALIKDAEYQVKAEAVLFAYLEIGNN